MKYSKDQQTFYDLALKGENLFLSGKAGTGKSFIVKEVVKELQRQGKNVLCCAPTGIAANNINGATIHSTFSLRPFGVLDFEACNFMKSSKKDGRKIVNAIVIKDNGNRFSYDIKTDYGNILKEFSMSEIKEYFHIQNMKEYFNIESHKNYIKI